MRRLAFVTALLALALAPAADAAVRHVVRGAGFGHGIGMSQYGAKGLAEHGRGHREILAHYYRGTEVSLAEGRTIRVLLQSGRDDIFFSGATRVPGRRLDPDRTYRVRPAGLSQVELRSARGKPLERFDAPLRVTSATGLVRLHGTAINGVSGGRYRGALEISPGVFGGLGAVNAVSLDDYVKGVVPAEVPASWHEEALKAQAVAARTYALATNRGGAVFDQYPDTRSQVYRGADGEQPRTNAAVEATANQVVTYGGAIVTTFFFSTSGGQTENVENVFYGAEPKPYLVSVEDPYDDGSPKHRWRLSFTQRQMQAKLRGLVKGKFRRIKVRKRGESPRVVAADVIGSRGRTRVSGTTLRARLGLYDTWARFNTVRTSARSARSASWIAKVLPIPKRQLVGSISPRPRGGRFLVERRTGKGWRRAARARTSRDGRYRVLVERAGVYRVRAGAVKGPAVRVR